MKFIPKYNYNSALGNTTVTLVKWLVPYGWWSAVTFMVCEVKIFTIEEDSGLVGHGNF